MAQVTTCITDGCTNEAAKKSRRCWPCKNARRRTPQDVRPCVDCGTPAMGERCRSCKNSRRCAVVEAGKRCTEPHRGRGMCAMHLHRAERHGDPSVTLRRANGEADALVQEAARATTDECILLTGRAGRPHAWVDGRLTTASRAVWIIANGDPGPDRQVLHRCNGGSGENGCINIRHLYLGDDLRNSRDKVEAGRSNREFEVWSCKLSDDEVREIRAKAASGTSYTALAASYGVSRSHIARIVRRERRQWVD